MREQVVSVFSIHLTADDYRTSNLGRVLCLFSSFFRKLFKIDIDILFRLNVRITKFGEILFLVRQMAGRDLKIYEMKVLCFFFSSCFEILS